MADQYTSDPNKYMNSRTIQIREIDGNPGHEGYKTMAATIITLVESKEVHLSELIDEVRTAVSLDIPPAYIIEDKRVYSEIGASGSGQELILSLMVTATDPAIAGASGAIVSHLITWAKRKKKSNEEMMRSEGYEESFPPQSLDFILLQVKAVVSRTFDVAEDEMFVKEAELRGSGADIRIKDTKNKTTYTIRTEDGYLITKINQASD